MNITDIGIDRIIDEDGSPDRAYGTATFDDGHTYHFYAMFRFEYAGFDVELTDAHYHHIEDREREDAALEAIRKHLGFDDIAKRERAKVKELEAKRLATCKKFIRDPSN